MIKSLESWAISPRGEKRFFQGHPWVFSNEITNSLKAVSPGQLVWLTNHKGQRLALGYGNPHSLIAFRVLERGDVGADNNWKLDEWILRQLLGAAEYRHRIGLSRYSHRLIFSEADNLPGLVLDVFKTTTGEQIFVLEILTAGAETLFPDEKLESLFQKFTAAARQRDWPYAEWSKTTLIVKRDNSFRKMENLENRPHKAFGARREDQLSAVEIVVARSLDKNESLVFHTDLWQGQKTGFFLDQRHNIELLLSHLPTLPKDRPIRILDLFCYVGQWSAQIAAELKSRGHDCEVTLADASAKALELAAKNAAPYVSQCQTLKLDLIEKASELPKEQFDIVICDPPALIKSKKDHHAGKGAYIKINTAGLRGLNKNGVFISCSCSQHLSDEDLIDVLSIAMQKSHKMLHWVAKGQQAADHPMHLEFPQGTYLNSWLGLAKGHIT